MLAETDLFLPNLDEARALTGESDVATILRALDEWTPGVVVVKDGKDGSFVADGEHVVVVHAIPVEADNAVGAGDVFDAGVLAGFLRGADVIEAMVSGTAAASHYVARRTDRFPSYEQCAKLMKLVNVATLAN